MNYKSAKRGNWTYVVVKKADQTKTTDITLAADTELTQIVPIGTYQFELKVILKSHATPDFKYGIIVTGTETGTWDNEGTSPISVSYGSSKSIQTDDAIEGLSIVGNVIAATECTIEFHWSQSTSDANDTIVKAGSTLYIRKIS